MFTSAAAGDPPSRSLPTAACKLSAGPFCRLQFRMAMTAADRPQSLWKRCRRVELPCHGGGGEGVTRQGGGAGGVGDVFGIESGAAAPSSHPGAGSFGLCYVSWRRSCSPRPPLFTLPALQCVSGCALGVFHFRMPAGRVSQNG